MLFQRNTRLARRGGQRVVRNPRFAPESLEGRLNPNGFGPAPFDFAPLEYHGMTIEVSATPPTPMPVPAPRPLPPAPDPILPPVPDPIPPSGPPMFSPPSGLPLVLTD